MYVMSESPDAADMNRSSFGSREGELLYRPFVEIIDRTLQDSLALCDVLTCYKNWEIIGEQ